MLKITKLPNVGNLTKACVICGGSGIVQKLDRYSDKVLKVHCTWCSGTGFVKPSPR